MKKKSSIWSGINSSKREARTLEILKEVVQDLTEPMKMFKK
jgi:hypothetical protein